MQTINLKDSHYPCLLRQIEDPPQVLYYKGTWDTDIFTHCLAVVGSRAMTAYGRRVADQLVGEIALAGVTIVSGFMYGIDAQAHRAALNAGGRTIAVMPCGIDIIHPEHQRELYQEIIAQGGLIISELESDSPPMLWTYPRRNRIVAGLSQAALVVEAGIDSGSLITASLAKNFGRKVFAVPGPLTSAVSQGTLKLIKEGTSMAVSCEDVLEFYSMNRAVSKTSANLRQGFNKLESKIVEQLSQEPQDIDSLSRALGLAVSELGVAISLMQLKGIVAQEGNKYYVDFKR